jgi:hypothetical protein
MSETASLASEDVAIFLATHKEQIQADIRKQLLRWRGPKRAYALREIWAEFCYREQQRLTDTRFYFLLFDGVLSRCLLGLERPDGYLVCQVGTMKVYGERQNK